MAVDIRERAREALRTEIADAMSDLFAERGFDAVTVEEAAAEVGISRATFFRYFGSKEDAVLAALEESSFDFGAVLSTLPPVDGENSWQLLHRTFRQSLTEIGDGSERERSRLRMIYATPSLRARLSDRHIVREESLVEALAELMSSREAARPIVVASLAVLNLAWRRWANGEETSLRKAVDAAFLDLEAANGPVLPPAA